MIAQVFDPTQLNIVSARVVLGAFAGVLLSDFRVRFLDIRFSYIFVVEICRNPLSYDYESQSFLTHAHASHTQILNATHHFCTLLYHLSAPCLELFVDYKLLLLHTNTAKSLKVQEAPVKNVLHVNFGNQHHPTPAPLTNDLIQVDTSLQFTQFVAWLRASCPIFWQL